MRHNLRNFPLENGVFGNVAVSKSICETSVIYHRTRILHVDHTTQTLTLDTGGWRTPSTKTAMNTALKQLSCGGEVWQKNHVWFVNMGGRTQEFTGDSIVIDLGKGV